MCAIIELKEHHFRFVATFTWEHTEDKIATQKLFSVIKKVPAGIDEETFHGFYLTGQRTMIFFGQTISGESLQKLSSLVSQNSAVKAKISLAVDVNDLVEMLKERSAK